MKNVQISQEDLNAYIDDELPAQRRIEVEAYLAEHPEAAETVHAYRAQDEALKALFNPVLNERVPDWLDRAVQPPAYKDVVAGKAWFLGAWTRRIAAGVVIATVSGSAGWMAHKEWQGDTPVVVVKEAPARYALSDLPRQAAVAHVVFSPDVKRPVEIGAEQEEQLVTWLSKRLNANIRPPKLGALGYELIGGRLLPGADGPVAQFMYHDITGQRVTLYVSTENPVNKDTAFRFAQEGPVNVFYWIDGKFGYALSAGIDKAELARLATAVYAQLAQKD